MNTVKQLTLINLHNVLLVNFASTNNFIDVLRQYKFVKGANIFFPLCVFNNKLHNAGRAVMLANGFSFIFVSGQKKRVLKNVAILLVKKDDRRVGK